MKTGWLEYIKVASLVVIAVSLSVIAWHSSEEASYLQRIEEHLSSIITASHAGFI